MLILIFYGYVVAKITQVVISRKYSVFWQKRKLGNHTVFVDVCPVKMACMKRTCHFFFFFINKCFVVTLALISVFERRANDSAALRASCCVTHGSTRVFYL